MAWRVARSLLVLRTEVDALAAKRNKASDGTIGDAAHRARKSDHNPNSKGVVCALDLTHDPKHGADMALVTEYARTHRHPALKYIIFNRRICSAKTGWRWVAYTGSSPHTAHAHFSVGGSYDDTVRWNVARAFAPAVAAGKTAAKTGRPTLRVGSRGKAVALVQRFLGATADGIFGSKTEAAVKRYQAMRALKADGIVGPQTWAHIMKGLG